jgi:transcription termination factor Rho
MCETEETVAVEESASLTIVATALIDTGSAWTS